jgi:hypothetical protein
MRPIRARIDSAALRHNLGAAGVSRRSRIWAVVKGEPYGHGLARATKPPGGRPRAHESAALDCPGEGAPDPADQGFYSPEELEIASHGFTTGARPRAARMLERARLPEIPSTSS